MSSTMSLKDDNHVNNIYTIEYSEGFRFYEKLFDGVNFTLWDVLLHDASDLVIVHNNPKGRRIVFINF